MVTLQKQISRVPSIQDWGPSYIHPWSNISKRLGRSKDTAIPKMSQLLERWHSCQFGPSFFSPTNPTIPQQLESIRILDINKQIFPVTWEVPEPETQGDSGPSRAAQPLRRTKRRHKLLAPVQGVSKMPNAATLPSGMASTHDSGLCWLWRGYDQRLLSLACVPAATDSH